MPCSVLLVKNMGKFLHQESYWSNVKNCESEVAQSCPTLSDPTDCSPPGSSIHGIFQARVLEWGAIAFSVREKQLSSKMRMPKRVWIV